MKLKFALPIYETAEFPFPLFLHHSTTFFCANSLLILPSFRLAAALHFLSLSPALLCLLLDFVFPSLRNLFASLLRYGRMNPRIVVIWTYLAGTFIQGVLLSGDFDAHTKRKHLSMYYFIGYWVSTVFLSEYEVIRRRIPLALAQGCSSKNS